ncbi:aspartate-semialdehyde dehydrogenase [Haliangium sp.]|uniref:aspartate-semialdehyde dehydrogenase n=1 Tax=Haliangium sp. TaxID=2663208 RepID=UPI003D122EC9
MTQTQRRDQIRVAVVGATGLAGQQFVAALAEHPLFRVVKLAASARSAGRPYGEALRADSGQLAWYGEGPLDPHLAAIELEPADALDPTSVDLIFTAVESGPARELEPIYARACPVVSTASAFRYESDVPLLLPGVNLEHVPLLRHQAEKRGWRGFVAPNPNCTTVGLAISLAPLHRAFGVEQVHMVSMQSVSGAGRSPGVIAMDAIDNIVPFIPNEEDKVQRETQKILGTLVGDHIDPAPFGVSCTCTRVGVLEGHTEAVHVRLAREASADEITAAWREFGTDFVAAGHPSCPDALIHVHDDPFRPQVRLDRDRGGGLTTSVGRLRPDANEPRGWKYMLVSHNTKMGAAKGCILVAEHLHASGLITARGA